MPAWMNSWCSAGPKPARLSISASSRHVVTSLMVALTWSARDWRRVAVSETSSRMPVVKIPCFSRRARYTGSMRVSSVMGGTGASASGIGRAEEVAIMAGPGRARDRGCPAPRRS